MEAAQERFHNFMNDQLQEMLKYKWIESEKAGKDLGPTCCLQWIDKYAKVYRDEWEKSH